MSRDTKNGNPTAFSTAETESQYRPISGLAVFCLVLGVLSILAFAHPMFWIIPLFAVVFSGFTAWRLDLAKVEYSGQVLAQGALLLGLVCGLSSVTRWHLEWFVYGREARAVCNQYVDAILTNNYDEVFTLRLPPPARYSGETLDAQKLRYVERQRSIIDAQEVLLLHGKLEKAQIRDVGPAYNLVYTEGYHAIACDYDVDLDDRLFSVRIVVRGARAPKGEWEGRSWYVHSAMVTAK